MPADVAALSADPPVAADVDLRDLPWVPFYRHRLWNSRFDNLASDAEFRAGFRLWMRSWDELPAGSLPNDERELAMLAGLRNDLRAWRKVRKWALHGWALASDGRLYHPVVAEIANHAWEQQLANRKRTAAATAARNAKRDDQRDVDVTSPPSDSPLNKHEMKNKNARTRAKGLQNGFEGKANGHAEPSPVNPKILNHFADCTCNNCERWAKLHQHQRMAE